MLQTWEPSHSAKQRLRSTASPLGYVNMAEGNVQCERHVVAMFWDSGSAVSSQQQSAGDHVQTAATSNRSNQWQQKQRQQADQEINEVFTGDLEKFSGARSGCQRDTSHIASDCDTELKSTSESSDRENTHKLSDGNIITAGAARFRCAEVLLQPSFIGKEASGIHDATSQSITKCDGTKPPSKAVTANQCLALGDVNMAEESVWCKMQDVAMFWVVTGDRTISLQSVGDYTKKSSQGTSSSDNGSNSKHANIEQVVIEIDVMRNVTNVDVRRSK